MSSLINVLALINGENAMNQNFSLSLELAVRFIKIILILCAFVRVVLYSGLIFNIFRGHDKEAVIALTLMLFLAHGAKFLIVWLVEIPVDMKVNGVYEREKYIKKYIFNKIFVFEIFVLVSLSIFCIPLAFDVFM